MPKITHDLGLFVDYSVVLTVAGAVVVTNLITKLAKEFTSVNDAVDYASARTNTLSPRYPAGYRSRSVRLLDDLGVTLRSTLLSIAARSEQIEYPTNTSIVEWHQSPHPIHAAEIAARQYLVLALEAECSTEREGFQERACDNMAFVESEKRNVIETERLRSEEASAIYTRPWQYVSGRSGAPAGSNRKRPEEKLPNNWKPPPHERVNMEPSAAAKRRSSVLQADAKAHPEVALLASISHF